MSNMISLRRSLLALALSTCATLASAATTLHIELNTVSFGTAGWIDLQFNPAPLAPAAATADLRHFVGFGDSATASWQEASGSLASGVHMSTANGPSSLFHEVNFSGGKVGFDVTIDSVAGSGGTAFSLAVLDSQGNALGVGQGGYSLLTLDWTPAATAGASGTLATGSYNANLVNVTAVPEPSGWLMLGAGVALLGLVRRRKLAA